MNDWNNRGTIYPIFQAIRPIDDNITIGPVFGIVRGLALNIGYKFISSIHALDKYHVSSVNDPNIAFKHAWCWRMFHASRFNYHHWRPDATVGIEPHHDDCNNDECHQNILANISQVTFQLLLVHFTATSFGL